VNSHRGNRNSSENSHNLPLCAGIRETILVVGNGMVSQRFCAKVIGEETWPAYDRVQLTKYFELMSAEPLLLATRAWYKQHDIELRTGIKVASVDLAAREVVTSEGERCVFDRLVLATGSAPFVPPVPGNRPRGLFVYRTIDDLEAIPKPPPSSQSWPWWWAAACWGWRPPRPAGPGPRNPRGRVRAAPDAGADRRHRRPPAARKIERAGRSGARGLQHREDADGARAVTGMVFSDGRPGST
jgi:hypothetical protein